MGQHVLYEGKHLGRFRVDHLGKISFVADNLESLVMLFSIKPEEKIETEGRGEIPFKTFMNDYLKKVSSFYPRENEYLSRGYESKTIEEFEKLNKLSQSL